MATLTKKDLLEAINGIITKINRCFCHCNDVYLSDRFIVNGHEYYELTCLRCGRRNFTLERQHDYFTEF